MELYYVCVWSVLNLVSASCSFSVRPLGGMTKFTWSQPMIVHCGTHIRHGLKVWGCARFCASFGNGAFVCNHLKHDAACSNAFTWQRSKSLSTFIHDSACSVTFGPCCNCSFVHVSKSWFIVPYLLGSGSWIVSYSGREGPWNGTFDHKLC